MENKGYLVKYETVSPNKIRIGKNKVYDPFQGE